MSIILTKKFIVNGLVSEQFLGTPLPNTTVQAMVLRSGQYYEVVGRPVTDKDGKFTLMFEVSFEDGESYVAPVLYFRTVMDGQAITYSLQPDVLGLEPTTQLTLTEGTNACTLYVWSALSLVADKRLLPTFRLVNATINSNNDLGYRGYGVKFQIEIDGTIVLDAGIATTDTRGYFKYQVAVTPRLLRYMELYPGSLQYRFSVLSKGETEEEEELIIAERILALAEMEEPHFFKVLPVPVTITEEVEGPPLTSVATLAASIGLNISSGSLATLAANGITSLLDIRNSGFIDPEDFEDEGDKESVAILNAHAQLELTTEDVQMRHFYIEAGFRSIGIIAKSMRHDFVLAGEEYTEVNELEKAKFFEAANAQYKVLNNVITQARLGMMYKNYEGPQLGNEHGHLCKCDDCMAAVSPLAYLADLLKYTTNHIKKDNALVSINTLQNTFKQPFGDLPASCDEMNRKLCQYRIGVEILRAYLAGKNPTTCQDTNLENAEKEYRQQAYFMLLRLMGTSFDEIRKAYAVVPSEREEKLRPLARRLGITFTPSKTSVASLDVNARQLVIEGNHLQSLLDAGRFRWTGTSANAVDDVFLTLDEDTPPTYDDNDDLTTVTVDESFSVGGGLLGEVEIDTIRQLFLDPTATSGLYEITEERLELLFGLRDSNRAPLAGQPMAFVLKWKLVYLREMWASEDHPLDDFSLRKRPIIDPDLIGPDDFRYPDGNEPAYGLWKARRNWIDNAVLPELKKEDNHTPWGVNIGERSFSVSANLTGLVIPGQQIRVVYADPDNTVVYHRVTGVIYDSGDTTTVVSVQEPLLASSVSEFEFEVRQRILEVIDTTTIKVMDSPFLSANGAGETLQIVGSRKNDGAYVVSSVNPSGANLDITLATPLDSDEFNDGYVRFTFTLTDADVTVNSISGQQISVLDIDSSVYNDITVMGSGDIEVTGSESNDGSYAILDNAASIVGIYTTIDVESTDVIPIASETGSIRYPKTVAITGVELGHRTFVINGHDLSDILEPSDNVEVTSSTGNDDITFTVARVDVAGGNTSVKVIEAIPNGSANGTLDLLFSIGVSSGVLTITGVDLTGFISDEDVILIRVDDDIVPLTVSGEPDCTDGITEITVVSSDGVGNGNSLVLSFPISEVDIRNKYFEVAGDYRKQISPGYGLSVSGSPDNDNEQNNDGDYTVERVTETAIYVVEAIMSEAFIEGDPEPSPTPDNYGQFTFQRLVPIAKRKPSVTGVFQSMLNTGLGSPLLNGSVSTTYPDGIPPWTLVTPATMTPEVMDGLLNLAKELRTGLNVDQNTELVKTYLNLPVDAFLALMAIVKKDKDSTGNSANEPVTDKEWEEFFNILILAIKNNMAQDWIEMEDGTTTDPDNGNASYFDPPITLDPQIFWVSLREPKPGNWPGETAVSEPLIDPQLISRHELPEVTAGSAAKALLEARREHLAELLDRLNDEEEEWHSAELARYIFGSLTETDQPLKDLQEMRMSLNSVVDASVVAARAFITNELRMTEQDFVGLMGYFDRLSSQGYQPTAVDKSVYHPMLVKAYKLRRLYPVWKQEESAMDFHRLRKAQLPSWRTTVRLRGQWQDALRFRSSIPSIDPDRVRPEDFKSYTSNAFQDVWADRRNVVQGYVDTLTNYSSGTDNVRITGMILHAMDFNIGSPTADISWFDQLEEDEKNGIDITARLAQLTLTYPAYRRLRQLREVAELPDTDNLLPSEWDEVLSILSNVMKRRLYAEWRDKEAQEGITLSQDFFKGNLMAFYDHPFQPARIQLWRLTYQERVEWQRTLLSRIENEEKSVAAHDALIMETEELTLRILRDGLVQAAGEPDKFLGENAEDMTTRFMFDFKTTCCQRTTRVSSAIDTLQMLIWSEATGMLERGPYNFTLHAPDFETEWKWIGSYATWRSAMFVYLFPENLLYPPLKRTQSPGFRKLVEDLRGNPRITPETACKAVHDFSNYWEEICNLHLEVTCNAMTTVSKGDCATRFIATDEYLFYSFAKSLKSGRIYYSVGKARCFDEDGQGFWTPIDGFGTSVERLLAAIPTPTRDNNRFIFVFAIVSEQGERKLALLKFDLNTQSWEEEYTAIDLPKGTTDLSEGYITVTRSDRTLNEIEVLLRPIGEEFKVVKNDIHGFSKHNETIFQKNYFDTTRCCWLNDEWTVYWLRFIESNSLNKPNESPVFIASLEVNWMSCQLYRFNGEYFIGSWQIGLYCHRLNLTNQNAFVPFQFIGDQAAVIGNVKYVSFYFKSQNLAQQVTIDLQKIADAFASLDFSFSGNTHNPSKSEFNIFCHTYVPILFSNGFPAYKTKFMSMYENEGWSTLAMGALEWLDLNPGEFPTPSVSSTFNGSTLTGGAKIMRLYYNLYISNVRLPFLDTRINLINTDHCYYTAFPNELTQVSVIAKNAGHNYYGNAGRMLLSAAQQSGQSNGIIRFEGYTSTIGNLTASRVRSNKVNLITPICSGPYHLPSRLSSADLQVKKDLQLVVYQNNASEPIQALMTCVAEAYYFVPMLVGLTLQERGHFQEALEWFTTVYDYRRKDVPDRKIWPGLLVEESYSNSYSLTTNWLLDPLNPHLLAASRPNSYTRYTLLAIIRCMLEFADAEFTVDTVESNSRARELYRYALELLQAPELVLKDDDCRCEDITEEIIRRISCEMGSELLAQWQWAIRGMAEQFEEFNSCHDAQDIIDSITDLILDNIDNPEVYDMTTILGNVEDEVITQHPDKTTHVVADTIFEGDRAQSTFSNSIYTDSTVQKTLFTAGFVVAENFEIAARYVSDASKENEQVASFNWLKSGNDIGLVTKGRNVLSYADDDRSYNPVFPTHSEVFGTLMVGTPNVWISILDRNKAESFPPNHYFCIPDNPVIAALQLRAELNLFKLRNCMNIAGMKRELEPYAAPTDTVSGLPMIGAGGQLVLPGTVRIRPTQYRYEVIMERAKQLVAHAQQMEANFLAALEKRDAEYYNRLKAKQDLNLSKAQVKLQDLRVKVAEGEVKMAELQRDRAQLQVEELQGMIDQGLLGEEQALVGLYIAKGIHDVISSVLGAAMGVASTSVTASTATVGFGAALTAASVYSAVAGVKAAMDAVSIGLGTSISVTQLYASQARREQEWGYQINMATQDIAIGNQGIAVAQSRVRVAGQEKKISELQVEHAEATLDFLSTKFTNVDLYDWMGKVLEGVYAYFLQQATATAKMAQNQLAFERQTLPPGFIVDDYWDVPTDSMAVATVGSGSADRRGMTGSARLLQDITKLDQYAFETDKRKLQITRTFSLAHLASVEFQRFRESGVLTFMTPMELFDRDFPGHYLRLIKEVRVSVIALTPSTEGIRATVTSSGVSRVVIGGDVFQGVAVRREPEVIAFSGTRDANGLFQLQPNDRFMKPFEASGVEMLWELRLPKESNQFDYGTIADVLFTIDYTALHDYAYQQQVLRTMPPFHSADLPISFRSALADQFYQLGHPEPVFNEETGLEEQQGDVTVSFTMGRSDFPPNLKGIRIREFKLYFATADGEPIGEDHLIWVQLTETPPESDEVIDFLDAKPIDNLISTAAGGGGLITLRNKPPFGTWHLRVPPEISKQIREQKITDIIMVITFSGDYPNQQSSF